MNLKFFIIIFTIAFSITGCRLLPRENGPRQGEVRMLSNVQYAQLSSDASIEKSLIIVKQ